MIAVIRAHDTVRLISTPALARILWALQTMADREQCDLVITCGTESHVKPDPHALGEALDVQTIHFDANRISRIYLGVRQILGPLFYVQYEVRPSDVIDPVLAGIAIPNPDATGPHLHLQRNKGTVYPPVTP